ncbi:hypothetical protein AB0O34_02635 [Sphaerisporangium sp. NPDC088356]|uniref:hypothetical protein n=1 Tax=Sphaerisporangium sp. NPDC088356 TaxID=3154871 RepID=UPI0034159A56
MSKTGGRVLLDLVKVCGGGSLGDFPLPGNHRSGNRSLAMPSGHAALRLWASYGYGSRLPGKQRTSGGRPSRYGGADPAAGDAMN